MVLYTIIKEMIFAILYHPPHPNPWSPPAPPKAGKPFPPFRVEKETIFASPVKGEDD
jgi:hypothetical protein